MFFKSLNSAGGTNTILLKIFAYLVFWWWWWSPVEHLQNLWVEICWLRPYDSHYCHPPQTTLWPPLWMHLLLCSSTHSVWFFHLQPVRNVYSLNIIKNSILILLHLNTCFTFVLTYVARCIDSCLRRSSRRLTGITGELTASVTGTHWATKHSTYYSFIFIVTVH